MRRVCAQNAAQFDATSDACDAVVPMADLPPLTIVRRVALWLVICTVSAAPSWTIASRMHASRAGMATAVLAFALIYGYLSCTSFFERLQRRPFVRPTMYVGYGLRLGLSLLVAMSLSRSPLFGLLPLRAFTGVSQFPDMWCGVASVWAVAWIAGTNLNDSGVIDTFVGAFATTCVQGAILNVVVFIVMAIAYGLQRAFRKPPAESLRGFEVVPISGA